MGSGVEEPGVADLCHLSSGLKAQFSLSLEEGQCGFWPLWALKKGDCRAWAAVSHVSNGGTIASLVMSTVHADNAVSHWASRALFGS